MQTLYQAKSYLNDLSCRIDKYTALWTLFMLHKRLKSIYDQVTINDIELKQLKLQIQKKNQTVMLLPSFKSVIDFTLLSYIHFMYEIELPFIAGLNDFD